MAEYTCCSSVALERPKENTCAFELRRCCHAVSSSPPTPPMSPTLPTCTLTLQLRRQFIDAVAPIVAHPACQRAVAMCSRLVSASTPRPSSAHRHVQGQDQVVSPPHSASTPSTAHAFLSTFVLRELTSCRPASFSRTELHTRTHTSTHTHYHDVVPAPSALLHTRTHTLTHKHKALHPLPDVAHTL
jgi:hypothetical protein